MINKDVFFLSSLRIEIHIFHIRCAVCTGITGYAMQLPAVYVVQYIFLFLNFSMNLFNFVHVSCVSVYFILFFVGVWYAFFPFFVCRSVAYFLVSLFLMIMNFVFVFADPLNLLQASGCMYQQQQQTQKHTKTSQQTELS